MRIQAAEARIANARRQTEEVLRAEARAVHGAKAGELSDKHGSQLFQALNRLHAAALCLSGGGIRSAAFSLGVIQALASHPRSAPSEEGQHGGPCAAAEDCLLAKFHYLSTVSGGGYIGSWLSAWRSRSPFWDPRHPADSIWANLVARPGGPDREPAPLAWLRSYSNYLTPRRGLLSADTWTAVALSARNLFLNWLIILPVFCTLILVLKIGAVLSDWLTRNESDCFTKDPGYVQASIAVAAIVCLIASLTFANRSRPTRRIAGRPGPDQSQVIGRFLIPSFLSAALLAQVLASNCVGGGWLLKPGTTIPNLPLWQMIGAGALGGIVVHAISWIAARLAMDLKDFALWTVSGAVYGSLVALGLYGFIQIPDDGVVINGQALFANYVLHLVFGLPWIIFSQLTADVVFAGLASYQSGSDADREWQGRAAGWLVVMAVGWFVLTFAVFFGAILAPKVLNEQSQAELKSWAATLAALFGTITAFLGASSITPFRDASRTRTSVLINAALSITAPLFVLALLIGLSFSLDQLLLHDNLVPRLFNDWADADEAPPLVDAAAAAPAAEPPTSLSRTQALVWLFGGLTGSFLLAAVASRCININRFSLHALYRNRLVRAFLGGSRPRRPDSFTGFDPDDNPRAHELWAAPEGGNWRPFHIINIALNVVSSARLSWQERKAEPFVVTPLHAGSSYLGFRDSKHYGDPNGISLGTAMAISGAAASPNMGYNSSPAITFLMTMLNVRLGWWLGNPGPLGQHTFMHDGPDWAIKPLVGEAFGLTTDERGYVYLSDGGHFENLGLYEAVRRRCRFIVVVDAGCDPDYAFEDLGNAVRKIAVDHGVQIRFYNLERLAKRSADGKAIADADYHAIGEIDYIGADGSAPTDGLPPIQNGRILYIKAGYHGTESAGVRSYANSRPEFPHESTLNQWFTESQFESYRSLGFEITETVLATAFGGAPAANYDIGSVVDALMKRAKAAQARPPAGGHSVIPVAPGGTPERP